MAFQSEYETIYILKPDLAEETVAEVSEKVTSIIGDNSGSLLEEDDWGKRKLAFPIQRNSRGHYVRFHYAGPSNLVAELERQLRYDDKLLRFLTVKMDTDVDIAALTAVYAERAKEAAAAAAIVAAEAAAAAAAKAEEEAAAAAAAPPAEEAPAAVEEAPAAAEEAPAAAEEAPAAAEEAPAAAEEAPAAEEAAAAAEAPAADEEV